MTELALMLLASQLISNPTPSAMDKYLALNQEDRTKVEAYIDQQDQLPNEIEEMITKSNEEQQSGRGGMTAQGPSRETYTK